MNKKSKCLPLAKRWYSPAVAEALQFDVLVIGSGASGLAAAVAAERAGARVAVATKGPSSPATPPRRRAASRPPFGDDDSPETHAEDVWKSSHETADRRLVEILTPRRPQRSTGSRSSASSSRARTAATGSPAAAARRASGSSRSATAPAMRSRRRCARRSRARRRHDVPAVAAHGARADASTAGARAAASTSSRRARSSSPPAGAASGRRRSAASCRPTIRVRPAR